jgi:hypothetical protein
LILFAGAGSAKFIIPGGAKNAPLPLISLANSNSAALREALR